MLLGLDTSDDAGVYRLNDEVALVQTVDVLTPIVDDPSTFGRIAAANALSDVYAMGARPITALNIVGFPNDKLDMDILAKILEGGLAKLDEAHCPLIGGHSLSDPQLKYGLSVTGVVHPDRFWKNHGLRVGDVLVLTKSLGTGILSTAVKAGVVEPETIEVMSASMARLNREASQLAQDLDVSACTDVTGFGLIGHACEMTDDTELGLVVSASALPLLPDVQRYADQGLAPGGLHRNQCHRLHQVHVAEGVPRFVLDILFDPQTSGGLLVGLPSTQATEYVQALTKSGHQAAVVAEVVQDPDRTVTVV